MQEEWDHTYRLRPYFRNVGLAATGFFLCAWIVSVLAAYFNTDGSFARPGLAILLFSVAWGGFTLIGVWLILSYVKYRLFLNDSRLLLVGVLRSKSVAFDSIQETKWRLIPQAGSVVLSSPESTVTIEFNHFTETERRELVSLLHDRIGDDRQTNWNTFHDCFIAHSPQRARRQSLAKRLLVFNVFAFGAVFALLWLSGHGIHFLVFSVVNVLAGLWWVRKARREGTDNAA